MSGAYRRDIDGLRGLAVLAVVLFHAGIKGFAGGFIGVDMFLVISGYLITGVIQREADSGHFTLIGFYERRVRRILPALLVMLATAAVAATLILLPFDFEQFGSSLASISVFASNFYFARGSGYFNLAATTPALLHTWSLAVEEQFYLLFPALLLLSRRAGSRGTQAALAAAALLSFLYSVWAVRTDPVMAFYSPASRAWEFLAGSLLASGLVRTPERRDIGDVAAALGLVVLGCSLWRLRPDMPFPGVHGLGPVLGTSLVLFGSATEGSRVARALGNRPLVAIGLISYSLYLWHWPMIVLGGYYVLDDHMLRIVRVVMAGLSFPVAWLSWRFVEQPFRAPRSLLSRRSLFLGAAAASLALAGYGIAIRVGHGIPTRFSPLVQRMTEKGTPDYGCTGRPIGSLSTDPGCWIGAPGVQPTFVLWGDSHAEMYVPALRDMARAHGVSGYDITALACPPLLAEPGPDAQLREIQRHGKTLARQRKLAGCRERNEQALQFIARTRPRAVVLAANWTSYDTGKHFYSAARDLAALKAVIQALREQGVAVYVVLDVPQASGLSTDQLAKARVIGATVHIEPGTADYLHQAQAMRAPMLDLQRRGLIRVIEPAQLLCGRTMCRMADGDYPLYFDSNHLNARGVHFVGPLFEPMFRQLGN